MCHAPRLATSPAGQKLIAMAELRTNEIQQRSFVYNGSMKRWAYGVLLVAVAGCGGDDDRCTPKRTVAAEQVVAVLPSLEAGRESAKGAVEAAERKLDELDTGEKDLAERIKLFEQAMDCLVYKDDCCKRLGRMADRRGIWSAMMYVEGGPGIPRVPDAVAAVLAPMKPLEHDAADLPASSAKETEKFCTDVRAHLVRIRQEVPAAWNTARADIKSDLAAKNAALADAQRRITAIGAWADAIRKNQPATIAPEPSDGPGGFGKARDAVAAYNAACH